MRGSRTAIVVTLLAVLATLAVVVPVLPGGIGLGGLDGDRPGGDGSGASQAGPNPCAGTITEPPAGTTLITIQGFRFQTNEKTPGLLVGVAPDGRVIGVHDNSAHGRRWTYDVDPLPSGNLLLATTEPGITVVEEIDPRTGEHVAVERYLRVTDAHDVDRINDGSELVMVDKGERHNRLIVYDAETSDVTWEWRFDEHYPERGGGPYPDDWTHVNDVDQIDDGRFLVSVRNFDQVVVVNRSSEAVELRLGRDEATAILDAQHNPQYLEGPNGTPTLLVADSKNDRVVEYARRDGTWERTWELVGGGLREPRDADRLPNGNTLVVDRLGHRTLEVTPDGTVVWEFYSPWQPYDVERYRLGDEPGGPTTEALNATGRATLRGSADFSTADIEACSEYLNAFGGGGRLVPDDEIDR
jgi:hypothetical protein